MSEVITGEQRSKVSFWCSTCRTDQDLEAVKAPWTWNGSHEWYWAAKCIDCGRKLTRFAAAMSPNDPYYRQSKKRKEDFHTHRRDLLQPYQDGFRTYYRESADKLEKEAEENVGRKVHKRKKMEKKFKKLLDQERMPEANVSQDKKFSKIREMYLSDGL